MHVTRQSPTQKIQKNQQSHFHYSNIFNIPAPSLFLSCLNLHVQDNGDDDDNSIHDVDESQDAQHEIPNHHESSLVDDDDDDNTTSELLPQKQTKSHQSPLFDAIQNLHDKDSNKNDMVMMKDAMRVFHGRGNCFPGCEHLTLDWFPPVWLLTSHKIPLTPEEISQVQHALSLFQQQQSPPHHHEDDDDNQSLPSATINLVYQYRGINSTTTELVTGKVPDPHIVPERGMNFLVQLAGRNANKNHGIFLDMANGRDWVRNHARDKVVLNLFAYTCGFSIAALMGGAEEVINVDKVHGVLKVGQRNHELNHEHYDPEDTTVRFLAHDIFKTWGKIKKLGPYDMIIVDPPSFQKKSFVASKDYNKIIRRLPDLLDDDGHALLCLNAPELDSAWLQNIVSQEAQELEFVQRLDNPPSFPSLDPERALKVLIYKKSSAPDVGMEVEIEQE